MFRRSGSGKNYNYVSEIPRGPACAYAIYLQDHYRKYKKVYPFPGQRNLMVYCATRWREEKPEVKDRYIQWAKADKERVKQERLKWLERVQLGLTPYVPLRKRRPRPPGYPRPTRNAFMFFTAEVRPDIRAKNPNMMACDVMKEIGARWRQLDLEGKQRYNDMSAADKSRFQAGKTRCREVEQARKQAASREKMRERLDKLFNARVPNAGRVDQNVEEVLDAQ